MRDFSNTYRELASTYWEIVTEDITNFFDDFWEKNIRNRNIPADDFESLAANIACTIAQKIHNTLWSSTPGIKWIDGPDDEIWLRFEVLDTLEANDLLDRKNGKNIFLAINLDPETVQKIDDTQFLIMSILREHEKEIWSKKIEYLT